jgi:branched-chain amino acid transport system substrate-binding protein
MPASCPSYFKELYLDLGGKIIMESFVNDSDLVSLSWAVGNESPDMIYLAAGPKEARAMIEVMRKAGIQSPVFGGDSLDSPELRGQDMGRIVFSTHVLMDGNSSGKEREFARAYQAEYGYPPENAFSALGYDTFNLLADAIGRACSDDPQAIFEALENTSGFKGVTGEISYQDGDHIPGKDVTMILMTNGRIVSSHIVTSKQST